MTSSPDVKVIDSIGEGWVMCQMQNVQGDIFYMSTETNEVALHPPGSPPAPPLPKGKAATPSWEQGHNEAIIKGHNEVIRRGRNDMMRNTQDLMCDNESAYIVPARASHNGMITPSAPVATRASVEVESTSFEVRSPSRLAPRVVYPTRQVSQAKNQGINPSRQASQVCYEASYPSQQAIKYEPIKYVQPVMYAQEYEAMKYVQPVTYTQTSYSKPIHQYASTDRRLLAGYDVYYDNGHQILVEY